MTSEDFALSFVLPTTPVAQPRPSSRAFITKAGKLTSRIHDDAKHKVHFYRFCVGQEARKAMGDSPPLDRGVLVRVELEFTFKRPGNHYHHRVSGFVLRDDAPIYVHTKPDFDNLIKSTLDAMNEIVYADDRQAVIGKIRKLYCVEGEYPSTTVTISFVEIVADRYLSKSRS